MVEGKEEKKFTTISIPTQLAEKIKKRIEGTGFHSLSAYATYVLREVISGVEEEEKEEEAFSKEDEEKVKERLRALGYLD
jgi:Arc/MetJ-type ribon-helix-helix transcriptional regulator